CYGRLESIIPPITVPAWMCLSTSQDPGSLGMYGFRNRLDYSYNALGVANSHLVNAPAMWDLVALEGGIVNVIGVPPGYPPRQVNGVWVSGFLAPDTVEGVYTWPESAAQDIRHLVGDYPVDVKNFRTHNKEWLRDEIWSMT